MHKSLSFSLRWRPCTTLPNIIDPKPEDVDDAMKFIYQCRKNDWPCRHFLNCVHKSPNFKESEKTVTIDVCSGILVPLCNEVILEPRYREDLTRMTHPSTLTCSDIGLGTPNTWHGTPDIRGRAGGVNLLYSKISSVVFSCYSYQRMVIIILSHICTEVIINFRLSGGQHKH